eukprot:gene14727-20771_t
MMYTDQYSLAHPERRDLAMAFSGATQRYDQFAIGRYNRFSRTQIHNSASPARLQPATMASLNACTRLPVIASSSGSRKCVYPLLRSSPSVLSRPIAVAAHRQISIGSRFGQQQCFKRPSTSVHATDSKEVLEGEQGLVGEDAADFSIEKQSVKSWGIFFVLLTVVLAALYEVWIAPGSGLASDYVTGVESFTQNNPDATIIAILAVFALAHSGLAALRPAGEKVIGARAYRVIFALVSLPLAVVAIVYFINHRYDGVQLWDIKEVPGVHSLLWVINLISFYFLYPSTFNILEVPAIDEPKLHKWETGFMRITRHPRWWARPPGA